MAYDRLDDLAIAEGATTVGRLEHVSQTHSMAVRLVSAHLDCCLKADRMVARGKSRLRSIASQLS